MARGRRRKVVVQNNSNYNDNSSFRVRRSSMRVNLSFTSNLSNSENGLSKISSDESDLSKSEKSSIKSNDFHTYMNKKPCTSDNTKTPASVSNITVINNVDDNSLQVISNTDEIQDSSLKIIKEKEQQLNKTCMQLKDAIMNKTQALFDRENELAIKTSEVLATRSDSSNTKTDETNEKRSPSIKVNIKKNEQLVMTGDGRNKNPVQVNAMVRNDFLDKEAQQREDYLNCNQSIITTPKKLRTANFNDGKETFKNFNTLIRIPVVRLFAEDSDPNNSLSDIISSTVISPKRTELDVNKINVNNISKEKNELNYAISPILSQGTRKKSRISCLSLKKKLTKRFTQNSNQSVNNTVESYINRNPLISSSLTEKQENAHDKNEENKNDKTIDLAEKSDSSDNYITINLDDNDKSDKTINVENSANKSSMEITAISAKMPIIHRSFQKTIRKSLQLDNIISIIHPNENVNKDSNIIQNDCSNNTICTSLNVNTSLDQISLTDQIAQKENKKPNNTERKESNVTASQFEEDNTIVPCQSTKIVLSSMQVNTSLDPVEKSSVPNNINQEQAMSDKTIMQQPQTNINAEKGNSGYKESKQSTNSLNSDQENNDKIISRPSISTVRSSMQVNTSLDSARKSPVTKNVLDFNQILSMVEETTNINDASVVSEHSGNHSLNSDSELENVSLMERIRNISSTKKSYNSQKPRSTV